MIWHTLMYFCSSVLVTTDITYALQITHLVIQMAQWLSYLKCPYFVFIVALCNSISTFISKLVNKKNFFFMSVAKGMYYTAVKMSLPRATQCKVRPNIIKSPWDVKSDITGKAPHMIQHSPRSIALFNGVLYLHNVIWTMKLRLSTSMTWRQQLTSQECSSKCPSQRTRTNAPAHYFAKFSTMVHLHCHPWPYLYLGRVCHNINLPTLVGSTMVI